MAELERNSRLSTCRLELLELLMRLLFLFALHVCPAVRPPW